MSASVKLLSQLANHIHYVLYGIAKHMAKLLRVRKFSRLATGSSLGLLDNLWL